MTKDEWLKLLALAWEANDAAMRASEVAKVAAMAAAAAWTAERAAYDAYYEECVRSRKVTP